MIHEKCQSKRVQYLYFSWFREIPLPSDPRSRRAAGAPGWAEVRALHLYTDHHRSLSKGGGLLLDDPP